ncbi:MAG: hypothetical protein WA996_23240 [Candidatus Promineifilaceae bacterium]
MASNEVPAEREKFGNNQRSARPTAKLEGRIKIFIASFSLLLASLACAFLPSGPDSEATTSPLSSGDILTFQLPISVLTMEPGETIPYTQLTYEGHEGNIYRVSIDNKPADKRVGDSFRWRGVIAPGVTAHYNLRIAPTFSRDNMLVGGSVEFGIFNPIPIEMDGDPSLGNGLLHFSNIFVDYTVPIGEQIPGTTITFDGQEEEDAELSGVAGYPYRAVGDSVIWPGRLRGNTTVRYSLRVVSVREDSLRLIGSAELWISPDQ